MSGLSVGGGENVADDVDYEAMVKKFGPLLREARETVARAHDQLLAIEQLIAGTDPVREISDFWMGQWVAKYRVDYQWSYAKDRANIKRLHKTLGLTDLKARIVAYLSSEEDFHVRNKHPFGVFVATVNSWGGRLKPRPVGCLHDEACPDDVVCTRKRMAEARA